VRLELPIVGPIQEFGNVARGEHLLYADPRMTNLLLVLLHLAVMAAKLGRRGGVRAVMAENLLLKHQLIVLRRGRQRAPNLTWPDRVLCGFWSLFLGPGRIRKAAIAFRPATLLAFHQALVRRKYRRLFSSRPGPKRPGPRGPDDALVRAIVELKSRNPPAATRRTLAPLQSPNAVTALKAENVKVTTEPRPLTLPSGVSMRLAFIEGPEGVRIELVQR
jgi:hypothetical protein